MMIAYRFSPATRGRQPGEIIAPGVFGQAVQQFGEHQTREAVFEKIRLLHRPQCVSRLAANFALLSLDMAPRYWAYADPETQLWEVEVADSTPVTLADMLWLEGSAEHDQAYWANSALRYWLSLPRDTTPLWEVIVGGPLRLLRVIEKVAAPLSAPPVVEP